MKVINLFLIFLLYLNNIHNQSKQNSRKLLDNYLKNHSKQCLINPTTNKIYKKEDLLTLSNKDKVNAFKSSTCPPIILIPGFMGTKLDFYMIDHIKFRKYHKNIVESCGWDTCENPKLSHFRLWVNIELESLLPNLFEFIDTLSPSSSSSYSGKKVYIPNLISDITIDHKVIEVPRRKQCLGQLLRVYYIKTDTGYRPSQLKGAKITIASSTKENCHKDTISNYASDYIKIRNLQGFDQMNLFLSELGYINGLSLFNYAYDFRLGLNNSIKDLHEMIKLTYSITKKKPVLISHSLGGLLAYEYSKEYNDLIEEVITISTPFLGAPEALNKLLQPQTDMNINAKIKMYTSDIKVHGNVNKEDMALYIMTSPIYEFLPRKMVNDTIDFMLQNAIEDNHSWLYDIFPHENTLQKIKNVFDDNDNMEKNKNKIGYANLYNMEFNIGNDTLFNLRNDLKNKIMQIGLKNLPLLNKNLHNDFLLTESYFDYFYKQYLNVNNQSYTHPKIPYTFIYANHLETSLYNTKINSDGTVPSFSAIYPGLRWLTKQQQQTQSSKDNNEINNFPIHFIDYCSSYTTNQKQIYQKEINQYLSYQCDCIESSHLISKEDCNHASLLNDSHLLTFLLRFINHSKSHPLIIDKYKDLYDLPFNSKLRCANLHP